MFRIFILILTGCLLVLSVHSQCTTIATWNIANMGGSKDEAEIKVMASVIKNYDIVAIQEVSTGPPGAQAVARLADALNRSGSKWDYRISEPTTGEGSERYAYIWNTSKAQLSGKPWLEDSLQHLINREPFLAFFISNSDTFLIATIHAVPKDKNPAAEISKLYKLNHLYEKHALIILGDFNLSAGSDAFNSLKKRKVIPALTGQKTSLKMKPGPNGEHLANEYDNILYEEDEIVLEKAGVSDFSLAFSDLKEAWLISDHIPVWGCFRIKK